MGGVARGCEGLFLLEFSDWKLLVALNLAKGVFVNQFNVPNAN